jgi:hypothetical protein
MFIRIFWQEAVPCSHKSGLIAVNGYLYLVFGILVLGVLLAFVGFFK